MPEQLTLGPQVVLMAGEAMWATGGIIIWCHVACPVGALIEVQPSSYGGLWTSHNVL